MARPKLPLAKARLTGAAAKNPQCYRGLAEHTVTAPIGSAPAWLPDPAKTAWRSFCAELPWLMASDRAILASAALLRTRIAERASVTLGLLREYRATLGCLGATPVDCNRVHWRSPQDDNDPWDNFDHLAQ